MQGAVRLPHHHDVLGLHVEVVHVLIVKIVESLSYLPGDAHRLRLGKPSLFLDIFIQGILSQELHHIIDGIVGFKHLVDRHDTLMMEVMQAIRLGEEVSTAFLVIRQVGILHQHTSVRITLADVCHEKLLDGIAVDLWDVALINRAFRQVGDAEATTSQDGLQEIFHLACVQAVGGTIRK